MDGHHRIAAYRGLKQSKIKARVLDCSYKEMLLISGRLHLDASSPLTQAERSDFAWRLVAEELGYTKKETSQATGIGVRTIGYMRATLKDLKSREIEPPCTWWEAKRAQRDEEDEPPEFKNDEEAERQLEGAAKLIRKVFDRAKNEFPVKELGESLRRWCSTAMDAIISALMRDFLETVVGLILGGLGWEWPSTCLPFL